MNITGWPVENSSAFVQKGTKTIMEKKRKSDWILALKMLGNMAIAREATAAIAQITA